MNNWDKLAEILQDYELASLRDIIYSRMKNCRNLKWKMIDIIQDSANEWQEQNPLTQSEIISQIKETTM